MHLSQGLLINKYTVDGNQCVELALLAEQDALYFEYLGAEATTEPKTFTEHGVLPTTGGIPTYLNNLHYGGLHPLLKKYIVPKEIQDGSKIMYLKQYLLNYKETLKMMEDATEKTGVSPTPLFHGPEIWLRTDTKNLLKGYNEQMVYIHPSKSHHSVYVKFYRPYLPIVQIKGTTPVYANNDDTSSLLIPI